MSNTAPSSPVPPPARPHLPAELRNAKSEAKRDAMRRLAEQRDAGIRTDLRRPGLKFATFHGTQP